MESARLTRSEPTVPKQKHDGVNVQHVQRQMDNYHVLELSPSDIGPGRSVMEVMSLVSHQGTDSEV